MLCNSAKNIVSKRRMIIITNLDPEGKYIDNNLLKVGYREKAKPYSGEMTNDPSQHMDPKYIDVYLDKIEAAHRGFEHNHNTYYGYQAKSIPYNDKISTDPKKMMDTKHIDVWLEQIGETQRDYDSYNDNDFKNKIIYGPQNKKDVCALFSVEGNTAEPWCDYPIDYTIDVDQLIEGIEKIHKDQIKRNSE